MIQNNKALKLYELFLLERQSLRVIQNNKALKPIINSIYGLDSLRVIQNNKALKLIDVEYDGWYWFKSDTK